MNCTCSKGCKIHGNRSGHRVVSTSLRAGFNLVECMKTGDYSQDMSAKMMMCRVLNDRALDQIMKETGIMIDRLYELRYSSKDLCLGLNTSMGHSIGVVTRVNSTMLDYSTVVAIVLHEIAHCSYSNHGRDFVNLEQILRRKYLKIAPSVGSIKVWDKFEFPTSTGSSLMINTGPSLVDLVKRLIEFLVNLINVIIDYIQSCFK